MSEGQHHHQDAQTHLAAGQPTLAAVTIRSLSDTDRLAATLHRHLPPCCCLGLVGTLGAGKTRLVQGLAAALGVDPQAVTSPTFTLVQHYQADRLLYHLDAYRVADADEFWELGVEEMFQQQALTVVEWADRVADSMPETTLWVRIALTDDAQTRTVRFAGNAPVWKAAVERIARDYAAAQPDPQTERRR